MPEPPWCNSPYVDQKYWNDPNPPEEAFANLPCCGCKSNEIDKKALIEGCEEQMNYLRDILHKSKNIRINEQVDIIASATFSALKKIIVILNEIS